MLESQQPVRFHQLTALRPCQMPRVPHGLAEQEHPRAGGRSAKLVRGLGQRQPMIAKKPAHMDQVGTWQGVESSVVSHGVHPVVSLHQCGSFKKPVFLLSGGHSGQARCSSSKVHGTGSVSNSIAPGLSEVSGSARPHNKARAGSGNRWRPRATPSRACVAKPEFLSGKGQPCMVLHHAVTSALRAGSMWSRMPRQGLKKQIERKLGLFLERRVMPFRVSGPVDLTEGPTGPETGICKFEGGYTHFGRIEIRGRLPHFWLKSMDRDVQSPMGRDAFLPCSGGTRLQPIHCAPGTQSRTCISDSPVAHFRSYAGESPPNALISLTVSRPYRRSQKILRD